MKLNYPKKLMRFYDSETFFEDGQMDIAQFSVMRNKGDNSLNLVIGYSADNKYIVVKNRPFKDGAVDAYPILQKSLEDKEYYQKVSRKHATTCLYKADVGDQVMCVAKERYSGIGLGEVHKVSSITPEGRLQFDSVSFQYTYEQKYFIVVDRKNFLVEDKSGELEVRTLTTNASTTTNLVVNNGTTSVKLEAEIPLIRRNAYKKKPSKKRKVYKVDLLRRSGV